MSRKSGKHKHGEHSDLAVTQENREKDDGFSFPVGVPTGAKTPVLFFCRASQCPGFDYPASQTSHPTATCGSIVNMMDDPSRTPNDDEMRKSTTSLTALASTGFASETIAQHVDQPTSTEPDSSVSSGPKSDVSELAPMAEKPSEPLPSAPESTDPDPRQSDEQPQAAAPYVASILVGTFWERSGGSWVQILSETSHAGQKYFQIAEFRVAGWSVINCRGDALERGIESAELRGPAEPPGWVLVQSERPWAAFEEGIFYDFAGNNILAKSPTEQPQTEPESAPAAELDPFLLSVEQRCNGIANELAISSQTVKRWVDSVLQTAEQLVTFVEISNTSPIFPALRARFASTDGRRYILDLAKGVFQGPIRDAIEEAANEQVERVQESLNEADEKLATLKDKVDATIGDLENAVPSDEGESLPIGAQLEQIRKSSSELFTSMQRTLDELKEKLDELDREVGGLNDRVEAVQKSQKGSIPPRKTAAKLRNERAAKEDDLDGFEDDLDGFEDDLDGFEDDLDGFEASTPPKRGPGRPPKASTPPKRGPGRPPKRGPGRPPKASTPPKRGPGRPPKRGPGRPPKRGPGRPPKASTPPKRGPGRPPKPTGLRQVPITTIEAFMRGKKHPKVRALLAQLEPNKWAKFVRTCDAQNPDLTLTPWKPKEKSIFAQWFYSSRR